MSASPVRRIALELLGLVDTSQHALPDLLERKSLELEAAGGARDLGLLRHLVLGTLRHRGQLDALLSRISKRPLDKLDPQLLNLLRLGAFQLSPHSRIPEHAAVHETVRQAKRLGHSGIGSFVNALMRNLIRQHDSLMQQLEDPELVSDPIQRLANRTSHPRWLLERWVQQLGWDAASRRAESNNQEPPVDLRVNLEHIPLARASQLLEAEKIPFTPLDTAAGFRLTESADLPRVLALETDGTAAFYIQSRLSQLAAELAAAQAVGSIALDACAAPGGKSLVLSQQLPGDTQLQWHEQNQRRRKRLEQNFQRLGLQRPIPCQSPEDLENRCSLVLVDAPCTALGVLRRHPEIRWRRQPEDPARMAEVQLRVLQRFSRCVQSDGVLIYTVCTFEPEETEGLASAFLQAEPGFQPLPLGDEVLRLGWTRGALGLSSFGTTDGEDGYYLAAFRNTKTSV